jgi:hypothetical protein
MTAKCAELVMRCFEARTQAHVAHLTTNSYAEHKALDEFYNGIVDLADSFAEAAQGRYGLLKYPASSPKVGDRSHPESIPTELRQWIDGHRDECTKHRELQNLIDEILHLCDSTIYKLQQLS